ncbi:uncharacterized protein LOC126376806 [Pectinophora gossypiella]|uniref:uncharacterized protein LOC126376806 n=1 Tax=Pectinophora gossypiella TaxID=13191 RepID=UPI00214EDD06|nr:uncharacterized protein LOC126376806 [Pectinophora gossypiella]
MDMCNRLNSVNSLNDYIELTQYLENKHNNVEILLNMSTISCLKKIRCLEIEYFNKCDGIGAAFILFARMLSSPPLKIRGLLGSELIGLIQYWLDAVRKHLISHHIHWWMFLKHLLGFIKEIRQKDNSMSNILVEETAECMLDLATSGKPEVYQRYEILHTFNLFCAESSREVRQALRPKLDHYFVRLSSLLATCGDAATQQWSLEALLRWLQPRACAAARRQAAASWLPPHLYPPAAVAVFLHNSWKNFFQDAREFLNNCNEFNKLVTSVVCRRLAVGNIIVISGNENREMWLDINTGSDSMSVILLPEALDCLGVYGPACETLLIHRDTAQLVKLYREANAVAISVMTSQPPVLAPSAARVFDDQCDVTIVISSCSNLGRVDTALRTVFQDKYQLLLDVEDTAIASPSRPCRSRRNSMDEKSRFSHPVKEKPRRQGYMVKSRRPPGFLRSPSTASTTSLAQLHDKLSALPYYEFTKEPVSVVAHPELSVVSEQNESEISNSLNSTSTLKLTRCAERSFRAYIVQKQSQSDGEVVKSRDLDAIDEYNEHIFLDNRKNTKRSQSDNEYAKTRAKVAQTEGAISSLFAATVGSADESVLNATIHRLPKEKDLTTDNLIELLKKEALQANVTDKDRESDSGINTGDGKKTQERKTQDSETIEDTQYLGFKNIQHKKNIQAKTAKNIVVDKSTSDESNTEVINETPVNYVNVRKRNQSRKSVRKTETEKSEKVDDVTYNVQEVEDFFSQHFAHNQMGDLIISPTLAKKINETSSESSEEFLNANIDEDFDIRHEDLTDYHVVECLNDIVNKVCIDFDKCTEYLDKEETENEILDMAKSISASSKGHKQLPDTDHSNDELKDKENTKPAKATRSKSKKVIKLKFPAKKQKVQNPKTKSKLKLEPVSKMSTIIEDNNESDANKTSSSDAKKNSGDNNMETPVIRRRRKLYSPKDDEALFDKPPSDEVASNKPVEIVQSDEDDVALADIKKKTTVTPKSIVTVTPKSVASVTPKSAATCYKDIEKDRQKYKTLRRRKTKNAESPPSPKTTRLNEVFEKLKEKVENNEHIILVDKKSNKDIFNFTSDSEDEDFKQKKIEIQKRTSTTTVGSGTSVMSTRRGRAVSKVNYTENGKESSTETTTKPAKRKRVTKRKNAKAKACEIDIDRADLVDERMREAEPEVLNTSFVVEKAVDYIKNPEPIIKVPELEVIEDENAMDSIDIKQTTNIEVEDKKRKAKKTEKYYTKKNEVKKLTESTKDDDRTVSPLPGLIIETEKGKNDGEDSLTTNFVQKVQKIYKEGPDACNDTTTTQNMLSDNDRGNYSPQINITEELGRIINDNLNECKKKTESRISNIVEKISDINTIDDTMNSEEVTKSKNETKKPKRNKLSLKAKDKTDSSLNSNSIKDAKMDTKFIKNELEKSNKKVYKKSNAKSSKSNIQEMVCEDIISIENQVITRSKSSKYSSRSKELAMIDITGTEVISDKSIATDGITAHGDFDELPPSPKLLNEKLSPRELQDMDENIKDYYVKLNKEVNKSKDTNESKSNEGIEYEKEADIKSAKRVMREINSPSSSEQRSEKIRRNIFDCDVTKWLPSIRDTDSESCESSRKVRSPTVSLAKLTPEDIAKWLPSAKSTPRSSSEEVKEIRRSPRLVRNKKSQISPIQLDDFLIKTKPKKHDTSESKDDTLNSRSVEAAVKNTTNKFILRPTYESSPISKSSKSDKSPPKIAPKRKSPVAKTLEVKRRKLDLETVNVSGSTQSSNVDEWLRRMSATCKADNMDVSTDAIQTLMEKLDTTLVEIHQNTTKDFIGLFVEAQKQLTELKEERRKAYRETAVGILTAVTQLVDAQFSEMDQQAEERDGRFMSWLKERAGEVLRRDCRQKRALVALLRDDVQAVADHMVRSHTDEE